ncbi:hexosaminidase D-like [Physella acuta]|uniref:hexosaminidase D-like n=1 Tax=Physella acuta TaxID=109671 RepID=UPI0027DB1907|nr:hexosaminidase D-like [Physella acuta]XP_059144401.1 hexosaminidase D-like [Physella acuta]
MDDQQLHLPSRLVHLDFKGAPLCLTYIEKVLPLLKKWGATGLLIEYEDTFPYNGDLKSLAAPHAYSNDNIKHILKLASDTGLEVIPLVQTFGHLEFVLKHEEFSSLREVKKYPMALCPSNSEALQLVCRMIDQVMALHPNIQHFHMGCDEVYHLGICEVCKRNMVDNSLGRDQLFFSHVREVASYIKKMYPNVTIIMWDDMLRYSELPIILNCGLQNLVEPMIWHYLPKFMLPPDLWENLSAVFPNIWVASAFKGATGPRAPVTNIRYHLDNHGTWLDSLRAIKNKFKEVKGIAITGWQRYDHYAVLCELFPHGLPSLGLCLKLVEQGTSGQNDTEEVAKDLKFFTPIPINPYLSPEIPVCEFPGSEIYQLAIEFVHVEAACSELFVLDGMAAWMNEYNMERRFVNPVHVEPMLGRAISILDSVLSVDGKVKSTFKYVFLEGTETEWRSCFILPLIKRLETFISKARSLLAIKDDEDKDELTEIDEI